MRLPADPLAARPEVSQAIRQKPWFTIHAAAQVLASAACLAVGHLWPLGAAALLALLRFPRESWAGMTLGPANSVTLLRLGLFGVMVALFEHTDNAVLSALVLTNLALDGLDGLLARRTQSQSEFGAFFDTETDGLWTLAVCVALFNRDLMPLWILLPGLLRYLKLLSFALLPPRGASPHSWFGRFAFGFFMVGCAARFALPTPFGLVLVMLAALAIVTSFARELGFSYFRSRHSS